MASKGFQSALAIFTIASLHGRAPRSIAGQLNRLDEIGFDGRMNERRIHQLFRVSILLKGADAVSECVAGAALAFLSPGSIRHIVEALVRKELAEDPRDFVATHLLALAQHFSVGTKQFYVYYLVSHGVVKLFVVVGLLYGKLWSYPASLIVFAIFVGYQLYRFSYTHSVLLIALTVFDLLVMVLIWHEYRLVRRHLPTA